MNGFGKCLLSSVGALLIAFTATAADQAGDKYYSVLGSYISADSDRNADDGLGLEGTLGWVLSDAWNIEIYAGYDSIDGDSSEFDVDQIALGGNLLNVYRRGTSFQPYALVGLGMVNSDSDFNGGSDTNLQTSVGVGAFMLIFDDAVRIRTELVARWEDDTDVYQDWFINIGVAVPFGRKSDPVPAAVVIIDTDGDGVPDAVDQCPGTPVGAEVDEVGCELDSDGDGVVDSQDECPDTPPNTEVDAFGCPFPQIIKLPEVNFRTDSVMLLDGADATLAAAAATLIQNPGLVVVVAGHSDSQGDANYNRDLSQRRADAVREYLVTAGVDENRISAKGYGEDEPIADNSTADGRRENRRVELRVISDSLD
jgi:OOP family OmpA-OmpF porin